MSETVKELTLILMYLTSWKEHEDYLRRAWKGYDFGIINQLADDGLIIDGRRSKSIHISNDGEAKIPELLKKYGIKQE